VDTLTIESRLSPPTCFPVCREPWKGLPPQSLHELYFDEASVSLAPQRQQPTFGTHFVDELCTARTADDRRRVVRSLVHMMGFDTLAYATVQRLATGMQWRSVLTSYISRAWLDRYLQQNYMSIDPRLQAACESASPCVWDLDLLAAKNRGVRSTAVQSLLSEMDAQGLRSGLMFGIGTADADTRAIVSLCSASPRRQNITDGIIGQALVFGLSLHEFFASTEHPGRTSAAEPGLSGTERQILACVARGLSDKEIAQRLDTSHHNIDYHLRAIRRKLGASNRTHLAYLSGRMSLV
jgi:DNA-binding CsgD family transcriptional regulator